MHFRNDIKVSSHFYRFKRLHRSKKKTADRGRMQPEFLGQLQTVWCTLSCSHVAPQGLAPPPAPHVSTWTRHFR